MTFQEYQERVHDVLEALMDDLEQNPLTSMPPVAGGLDHVQERLKPVAAFLGQCDSLEEAVLAMKADRGRQLDVILLTTPDASRGGGGQTHEASAHQVAERANHTCAAFRAVPH